MSYVRPIDNSRLICKLIKSKPELYDPDHPDYSNRPLHGKLWKELAATMDVSVDDFRSKWASLRNSYARCLKAKNENPNRTRAKWYLEDHMDFLEKHILLRTKRRNFLDHFANAKFDDLDLDLDTNGNKNSNDRVSQRGDHDDNESISTFEEKKVNINKNYNGSHRSSRFDELDDIFDSNNSDQQQQQNIKSEKYSKSMKNQKLLNEQHCRSLSPQFDRLINSVTGFFELQANQLKQTPDDLFFQSIEKDYDKLTDKNKRKFKLTVLNALNELLDEAE